MRLLSQLKETRQPSHVPVRVEGKVPGTYMSSERAAQQAVRAERGRRARRAGKIGGVALAAVGVVGLGVGLIANAVSKHNAAEKAEAARKDAAVEAIVNPALDKIGADTLNLYNSTHAKHPNDIRLSENDKGDVVLSRTMTEKGETKWLRVVMGKNSDRTPNPSDTKYLDITTKNGDRGVELATRDGGVYVESNYYKGHEGEAFALSSAPQDPKFGAPKGVITTADGDLYHYNPQGSTVEDTAASVASRANSYYDDLTEDLQRA